MGSCVIVARIFLLLIHYVCRIYKVGSEVLLTFIHTDIARRAQPIFLYTGDLKSDDSFDSSNGKSTSYSTFSFNFPVIF